MAADVQLRMPTTHRLEHQNTIIVTDSAESSPSHNSNIRGSPSDNVENVQPQVSAAGASEQRRTSISAMGDCSINSGTLTSSPVHMKCVKTSGGRSISDNIPNTTGLSTPEKVKYGELVVLG